MLSGKVKLLAAAGGVAAMLIIGALLAVYAFDDEGDALAQINSSDPQQRLKALDRLAERPSKRADAALVKAFDDPDPRVAGRAVAKVGNWTHRDGLPHVTRALRDPRPEVRAAAVASVGKLRLREEVNTAPMIKMLADARQPREVRATAARSLGRMHCWEAMPQLVAALEDPDPRVRGQAGSAIRKILGVDFGFRAKDPDRQKAVAKIRAMWPSFRQAHLDYMRRLKEKGK